MEKKKKRRNKIIFFVIALCLVLITIIVVEFREKQNSEIIKIEHEEKDEIEDMWIDLKLTYIGSAKTERYGWGTSDIFISEGVEYSISGYLFFGTSEHYYEYEKSMSKVYDEDFVLEDKDGKRYVYVYGQKMKWLQYNPSRESTSGGYANRAGLDWDMEFTPYVLYFYEYDFSEYGYLADMTMEVFADDEGRVYWADEEKRRYLE